MAEGGRALIFIPQETGPGLEDAEGQQVPRPSQGGIRDRGYDRGGGGVR